MPRKAKNQKVSKSDKLLHLFQSKKFSLVFFLFVFSLLGGGVYLLQSSAASAPPSSLTGYKEISNIKASDGYVGKILCRTVTGSTGYGPVARCYQNNSSKGQYRPGYYSTINKSFSAETGWTSVEYNVGINNQCKNIDHQFRGGSPLKTSYGPVSYGQIYRYYGGKWQIKWATQSAVTKNCSTSGSWMNASSF